MALARMVPPMVMLVALAGFSPASGCARGCSSACRGSGGFTRSSANGLDDVARNLPRTRPPSGTLPPRHGVRPLVVPGQVGGEFAPRMTASALDDAVAALPPVEGSVSSLAKLPAGNGTVMVARPGARSLADDYARSIDSLGVTRQQHELLLDAFDAAQAIADAPRPGASDDPIDRELVDAARARVVASVLDGRLRHVLDDEQRQRFYAALGAPQVIAHRLARERPMQPAPATSPRPSAPPRDRAPDRSEVR